jgi:hypothetical protein
LQFTRFRVLCASSSGIRLETSRPSDKYIYVKSLPGNRFVRVFLCP